MQRCASVRKKGSLDQCPVAPVFGHTLCGRHARCKHPVLWADVHRTRHAGLIRAQALIRGHLVRTRLALAGPGVLCRKELSNDEDLVTMTETAAIDPFEYVGFTENGKTWAFEFSTLFTWALRSDIPVNPYTKVPLSTDTRTRLVRMWSYRLRRRIASREMSFLETCRLLAHIFQDNGFADIGTQSFLDIPRGTWIHFFRGLQQELLTMYPETALVRRRGIILCRRMEHVLHAGTHQAFCECSATSLLRLVLVPRDPYLLCFSILSCFYRC
jgi:hypothetical protein